MVPLIQEQTLFQHQMCLCVHYCVIPPMESVNHACTVVSVRITELKTHHAERGAAQERTHENARKESLQR